MQSIERKYVRVCARAHNEKLVTRRAMKEVSVTWFEGAHKDADLTLNNKFNKFAVELTGEYGKKHTHSELGNDKYLCKSACVHIALTSNTNVGKINASKTIVAWAIDIEKRCTEAFNKIACHFLLARTLDDERRRAIFN